jgi:hypothetical protein
MFHVPIVLKSGSLNLLEPLGPVQACNGIDLPLPLPLPLDGTSSDINLGFTIKKTELHKPNLDENMDLY